MDKNRDLLKVEDGKQKINMLPIIENITKLVGAVVIVIMFLMFFKVFYHGTFFHAMFTGFNGSATAHLKDLLTGNIIRLGSGDYWIAVTIWTVVFLAFLTTMISYIVYYIKDLIVLINEIIRTVDKIRNSVTESVKESALFNDDILGKSKREEKERKKIEDEEKRKIEKEMRDEIRKKLEAEYSEKEKEQKEQVKVEKPKAKAKEAQTYQENLIEEDPEIEGLSKEFQEVLRNTREKNKVVEQSKPLDNSVTDLSDEEIDELLKG